ncbi:restriction endonuclease subunit S [Legionella pneumophila serogroup 1]|nr:restriction endonuclease subunit S [Legionella pneumophila]HAT8810699.1 restriction endonuclease subunit S [Legionella pneumophila]HAU2155484.1 restriction endonuclease subunit S [Legionella pneumophila]
MSYEWEKIRLGDVSKVITDKIEISEINKKNYISTENMLPNFEGVVPASTIPNAKKVNAFRAKDILFSNIRTYFKKVWYATMDGGCSADVLVFRPKNSAIDNQFLSYVLKNEKFISYTVTTSKGTKMPRGDKKAIMNYQFYKPNLIDQQKITYILSTLDDKIELNKKINQTLESIAQAIFKSWFVDFDPVHAKANAQSEEEYDTIAKELGISRKILDLFPCEFEESELGLIPKGWEVMRVADIGKIVCGKTPPTKNPEYYGDAIPFITIPDMHGKIFQCLTKKYLSHLGIMVQKNKTIPPYSICISCIATPGLVIITSSAAQTNQQINSVIPNNQNEVFFWYWGFRNLADDIRASGSGGSVFSNLSTSRFAGLRIIAPPQELRFLYNEKFKCIFENILCHEKESNIAINLRDTLLPKLLSGEIDVSNLNLEPEHD